MGCVERTTAQGHAHIASSAASESFHRVTSLTPPLVGKLGVRAVVLVLVELIAVELMAVQLEACLVLNLQGKLEGTVS